MCIRQELSAATSTSAPVSRTCARLVRAHRHRGVGVLDRERAAEAAALLGRGQVDQRQPAHRAQQPVGPVADAEQRAASGRSGGRRPGAGSTRRRRSLAEHVEQELGQLVHPRRDPGDAGAQRGVPAFGGDRGVVVHDRPAHDADGVTTAS